MTRWWTYFVVDGPSHTLWKPTRTHWLKTNQSWTTITWKSSARSTLAWITSKRWVEVVHRPQAHILFHAFFCIGVQNPQQAHSDLDIMMVYKRRRGCTEFSGGGSCRMCTFEFCIRPCSRLGAKVTPKLFYDVLLGLLYLILCLQSILHRD